MRLVSGIIAPKTTRHGSAASPLRCQALCSVCRRAPTTSPNLYITGVFYSEITAAPNGYGLDIDPGNGNGPAIVAKYGDCLLDIGPTAIGYFNANFMLPAIESFFRDCGYR